jgi:hypothetical protein
MTELLDETKYLEQLDEHRAQLKTSVDVLFQIVDRCRPHAAAFAQLEKDRQREQNRANREAVECGKLEEEVKALRVVAACASDIIVNGDLQRRAPETEHDAREEALRSALRTALQVVGR